MDETMKRLREQRLDEEKNCLRREIAEKIKGLTGEYKKNADAAICRNTLALPEYAQAESIFCFVSMDSEVNTRPILKDAFRRGKRVCVPKCVARGVMELYEIKSFKDLEAGAYGIPEPKEACLKADVSQIGFGIIPCVSANKKGERLGHGGGYYDRFLKNAGFPFAIICREQILQDRIPMMEHDVRIPIVITEEGVVRAVYLETKAAI